MFPCYDVELGAFKSPLYITHTSHIAPGTMIMIAGTVDLLERKCRQLSPPVFEG